MKLNLSTGSNRSAYAFSCCSLFPRLSLLPRCPREVWERAGERTRSRHVSLGDVTTHGRVQDWPSRERLGTRLQLLYFTITDDGCTFFGPLTYNHMSCACVVSVAHLLSLDAYCIFSSALHQLYISIKDIASRENEQFSLDSIKKRETELQSLSSFDIIQLILEFSTQSSRRYYRLKKKLFERSSVKGERSEWLHQDQITFSSEYSRTWPLFLFRCSRHWAVTLKMFACTCTCMLNLFVTSMEINQSINKLQLRPARS